MVTPQTPVASIQTLQSSAGQEQPTSAGHFSFPPAARNAPTLNSGLMSPFAAPFEPARVVELSPLSVTALPLQVTPPDMYPLSGAQVDAVAFQLARRMHLTAARWQLLVHDDVITYRFDLDQRPCGTRTVEVGVPHFPAITGLVVTETYHYRRVSLLRLVIDFRLTYTSLLSCVILLWISCNPITTLTLKAFVSAKHSSRVHHPMAVWDLSPHLRVHRRVLQW